MISVAICTYNGELYIKELLDSILNQTMPVDEIVICDDKSTDNTIPIVQEIASTHNNATFIIIKNNTKLGVRKNFEKALNICNGDIKFLSDQDDIWFPTKVKTIYDYFNTNIVKTVVFTNALLIDNKNKPFSNKTLFECVGLDEYGIQLCNEGFLLNIFLTNGRTYGTTMAIRKNVNCFF